MTERPIAWLIRETRGQGFNARSRVMLGKVFRERANAEAAAARLTNRWTRCEALPVFEPTPQQIGGIE